MYSLSNKLKGYSLCKEFLISLLVATTFNAIIYCVSIFISQNYFITRSFIGIYYGAFVSFVAIYATIVVISTNLSQEFPLNISLKYIVNSRLSFSYLLLIILNILMIHILFLYSISANLENICLAFSTIILFICTIVFILLFLNTFKLKNHIKLFFEDMIKQYANDFSNNDLKYNWKNYSIIDNDGLYIVTSNDFENNKAIFELENTNPKKNSGNELESITTSEKHVSPIPLRIYLGHGKVKFKDWKFLDRLSVPVKLKISKYAFLDNILSFQVICEYLPTNNGYDIKAELEKIIKENITYKDFPKEEFKEVFDKLKKNGTEQKLIANIKDHIAKQDNLYERKFLYSSFEEFFKEAEFNRKPVLDIEELLNVEISGLYEQKTLFFKSPAIIAKLQDRLTFFLIRYFRRFDYFNPQLNTAGLYIKEFLDVRYKETYLKSDDPTWIEEYQTLVTNTITNMFKICRSIIELNIADNLKQQYLVTQLEDLNQVLDHYSYLRGSDFLKDYYDKNTDDSEKQQADKKIEFINKQKVFLKEKQSDLFYIILYNIDEKDLSNDFFDIALKIYNLEGFENQYYKYEKFDKLYWLNYDEFSGGAQINSPFNFTRYKLLISFYKFMNNGIMDIENFDNEFFINSYHSLQNEVDSLDEKFVSKYFDYGDDESLINFKKMVFAKVEEKKASIKNEKQNYIADTPPKKEYVDMFISDCKEEWQKIQSQILKFMKLEEIEDDHSVESPFGQYFLYDKKLLLDPFEKNVAFSRDSGKYFGKLQGDSKLRAIINSISESFDENKDREVYVKNIISDLSEVIVPNKDYYLFYNSNLKIYNILDINWNKEGIEKANLDINNSKIHLCFSNNTENILFEKESFLLQQYKQGYERINEPLVVQIETIDNEEDITAILNRDNNYKSERDVKQKVKVRIAEKFDVKRTNAAKLIKLNIVD